VPSTARLVIGATTCSQYAAGSGTDLTELRYNLSHGVINSVSPGTFAYFTRFTTSSGGPFTVQVAQSNDQSGVPRFDVQNSPSAHVILYNANCMVSALSQSLSVVNGQVTLNVSGATSGQQYILLVQYRTDTVVGAAPSPPTVHYDYLTYLNAVLVNRDPDGLNLRKC
jgi:hypothetical protein